MENNYLPLAYLLFGGIITTLLLISLYLKPHKSNMALAIKLKHPGALKWK